MVEVVLEAERALYMVRAGISKVRLGDRPSEPSLQKMVNQADGFLDSLCRCLGCVRGRIDIT